MKGTRWFAFALLLQLMLVNTTVSAEERVPGCFELNVWARSHHLSTPPRGRTFNEVNPGIGMRAFVAQASDVEFFLDFNHISRNSTKGRATLLGVGAQYPFVTIAHTDILVGAVAGGLRYENTWSRQTFNSPGVYPFAAVRHRNFAVTVGYIPKVESHGKSTYEALFGYVSYMF